MNIYTYASINLLPGYEIIIIITLTTAMDFHAFGGLPRLLLEVAIGRSSTDG